MEASANFSKARAKFFLSLHYNGIIITCLLMENKSLSLKLIMGVHNFQLSFV